MVFNQPQIVAHPTPEDYDMNELVYTHPEDVSASFSFYGQAIFEKIFKKSQQVFNNSKLSPLERRLERMYGLSFKKNVN